MSTQNQENQGEEKQEQVTLDVLLLAKLRDNQQKKAKLNEEIVNQKVAAYQLKKANETIESAMDSIYGEEHNLLKQIEQTYGSVNIDLESGVLTQRNPQQ